MPVPYLLLPAVEVPGWGQVPNCYIEDELTSCLAQLDILPPSALLSAYGEGLRRIAKTWRGAEAQDVLNYLYRTLEIELEEWIKENEERLIQEWDEYAV